MVPGEVKGRVVVLRNSEKTGGLPGKQKKTTKLYINLLLVFSRPVLACFSKKVFSQLIHNRAKKYQRIIIQVAIKLELSSQLKVTGDLREYTRSWYQ